jgi:hypothetical protein
MAEQFHHIDKEPDKTTGIDAEYLSGKRHDYQSDASVSAHVDLLAGTPGDDINWLEDIELLEEDGIPAVFDRYSNSFLKIYFPLPDDKAERDTIARKVLLMHLQSGNSYGIQLKALHCKYPQPTLGSWVSGSPVAGTAWKAPVLEGWAPKGH